MYLEEYINKAKNGNFLGEKKWLDHSAIIDNISGEIPDTKIEEWKNFRTNSIKNVDWKVLLKNQNSLPILKEEIDKTYNSLVFIDGYYSSEFSSSKYFIVLCTCKAKPTFWICCKMCPMGDIQSGL